MLFTRPRRGPRRGAGRRGRAARRAPALAELARGLPTSCVLAVKPARSRRRRRGARRRGAGGALGARRDPARAGSPRRFPGVPRAPGDAEPAGRGPPGGDLPRAADAHARRARAPSCSALLGAARRRRRARRERLIDAATAVMGCSPAYLALVAEALAEAGEREGLDPELAGELVAGDARRHGGAPASATTRRRSATPSPRPAAAPRPGSRRSSGVVRGCVRGRGQGLAGADARRVSAAPLAITRGDDRRLRRGAVPRLLRPDLRPDPAHLDPADALQPRRSGRWSASSRR